MRRSIPRSVLAQGAAVAYGWLHFHAARASYLSLTYGRHTYALRADGSWGEIAHPMAARLRLLAERLFARRDAVGQLLGARGGRYVPWDGV